MSAATIDSLQNKKSFRTGSIVVIVAGALMLGIGFIDMSMMCLIMGPIVMVLGIILLITGIISKGASETKNARTLGTIMILGGILVIAGIFVGSNISIGGAVIVLLIFLVWPCLCCQGQKDITMHVIGVASSHDRVKIGEIGRITGIDDKIVRESIYDAIGKGRLSGKIDGDTFVRSAPTTHGAQTITTREREIVKVLVICPYCGAKNEQGVAKCQNCQADL